MRLFRNIFPLVAVFLLIPAGLSAEGRKTVSYLDVIGFEDMSLEKGGKEVVLSMDIVLDSSKIRTQHTVALTPVLVSGDGSSEFPFGTVIVDGRARHKVFMRREVLKDADPGRDSALAVILRKNRSAQEYAYVSSIPYSPVMLDGKIEVREAVTGCADCGEGDSVKVLDSPVLPRFIPQWRTSRIEPAPEPVKHREESRIARLQFRWDRSDILESWKDNAAVLDTVTNSIALVKDRDYIAITGIYVAGFASPEGTWDYNMRLSRRRAESFARYIAEHNDVDPDLVKVEWSGEDWTGFRAGLLDSSFPKREQVIGLIDRFTGNRDECERQMMKIMTRSEYVWLLRNIYPYLRHCTYRVEYEVKGFDLEEARRMIRENPSALSLTEIYMVAGSYGTDSEEYRYAMEMAAEYYPDSPAVRGDLALAALDRDDAEAAVKLLEGRIQDEEPELMNILGVAYSRTGDYGKAQDAFSAAAVKGCGNAQHNLGQLAAVTDQLGL